MEGVNEGLRDELVLRLVALDDRHRSLLVLHRRCEEWLLLFRLERSQLPIVLQLLDNITDLVLVDLEEALLEPRHVEILRHVLLLHLDAHLVRARRDYHYLVVLLVVVVRIGEECLDQRGLTRAWLADDEHREVWQEVVLLLLRQLDTIQLFLLAGAI